MIGKKIKYIGEDDFPYLTKGKEYMVISVEKGFYRIETDHVGDYLFHPLLFEDISEPQIMGADPNRFQE